MWTLIEIYINKTHDTLNKYNE